VLETAHRALQNCGQVFRYAVQTGRCQRDPSGDLKGALTPWKPKHYPALTEPLKLAELLRSMDNYQGNLITRSALALTSRYMGYDQQTMTGHGFRAIARTLLDEALGFEPHIIEHQLAHGVKDPIGRAYNRTKHLPERIKMMQEWADYLDKLKLGAEIIPLNSLVKMKP